MAIITDLPECMTWQLCNPVYISYVLSRALFKYKQSLFRYENSHDKDMMVIRSYTIFLVPHLNLDIQWLHHAPKPHYIDRDQSMTFSTYCGLCSAKFTIYARWDIKVMGMMFSWDKYFSLSNEILCKTFSSILYLLIRSFCSLCFFIKTLLFFHFNLSPKWWQSIMQQ